MVTHTLINKTNTITQNSALNTGLNPVAEICYGVNLSRTLISFDIDKLQTMYGDKELGDLSKVKHCLKLTNCGSIENNFFNENLSTNCVNKKRATSFDIIVFTIPKQWDGGVGFEFQDSFYDLSDNGNVSIDACNWYQAQNGYLWQEEGVYSIETLTKEYDKYLSGDETSIIVGKQHFDFGNENFKIDITNIVNQMIIGIKPNYGFGLAFLPSLENTQTNITNYIGFFTNHTNTFFHPYIETINEQIIIDDRANFYMNKTNRLYLYSIINNNYENLDLIPRCRINDVEYEVKQGGKGIYYVEVPTNKDTFESDAIYYDEWSNLIYQNNVLDDVEMEFVVLNGNKSFFNIGNVILPKETFKPNLVGINNDETINQNDLRMIHVLFRKAYTTNGEVNVTDSEYRLYVKDGNSEIDVIEYHPINKVYLNNYFYINANELIPSKYYIDIKTKFNNEIKTFKEILTFNIEDNVTAMKK